jgi:hypothetical protein
MTRFWVVLPNLLLISKYLGYISHMDTATAQLSSALTQAVVRVLHALIRVLVRHGMALPAFVELAKRAYVEVALNDFAIPGRKPSVSRAALLTGLTRKEVQRLVEGQGPGAAATALPENRAARVVAGWVRDADFHRPDGEPLPLRFDGAEPTFSSLVRRHSGDVPPRAVLDELLRVGTVERGDDGLLRLMARVYIPRASDAAKLGILAADVPYLIGTIDHNLQGLEPSRFQRKVMYDNLPTEAMEEFRALTARHAQELIELLDRWLAQHDRDANPAVRGHGRVRAGVSIFSFEELIEPPSTDAPAARAKRRRTPASTLGENA